MAATFTLDQVEKARERMAGVIHKTPLDYSGTFSRLTGANIYLKLENMQKTGSFKIRGAYNRISLLSPGERSRGVISASAGNHAQGLAYAAARSGIKATIVMPEGSPLSKVMASRGYGAEVILAGKDYDQAFDRAGEIQRDTGATYVHGFNDHDVIVGQATLGLEILEQLASADAVVLPAGGGGLLGGVSFALKALRPQIKVYGVQSAGTPALYLLRKFGETGDLPVSATIAEGINVRRPGEIPFELVRKYVDDIVLVDDEEISQAILMLLERTKVMAEGAGAAALAAVIHGRLRLDGMNVVVVVSGGNIDINILSTIIERGLVKSGRRLRLKTIIPDRPGSLQKIISLVASQGVNIISIIHDRSRPGVPLRDAEVEFNLETTDREHVGGVVASIKEHGYSVEIL
ncbi:MAG: threonine ammonia-lyase [Bacillota bacterium]